ncbi:hypothetical protein DACRYDRAFT_15243 [Dacryopinax primogenitus]|uniref:Uncharacterized protein n=1 Tax=Dacryopinax primogenitus (strain DJM 731) TaxID=1858805 RepID=M5GDM8_DACPD|nr:uncharacterized protein DACRYDRAFT_15243 [Dacryopinax primogenitus]EJU02548.1 hypothetical protein DACRYDRAFT_15243 [Dacryopinax primogenitus]
MTKPHCLFLGLAIALLMHVKKLQWKTRSEIMTVNGAKHVLAQEQLLELKLVLGNMLEDIAQETSLSHAAVDGYFKGHHTGYKCMNEGPKWQQSKPFETYVIRRPPKFETIIRGKKQTQLMCRKPLSVMSAVKDYAPPAFFGTMLSKLFFEDVFRQKNWSLPMNHIVPAEEPRCASGDAAAKMQYKKFGQVVEDKYKLMLHGQPLDELKNLSDISSMLLLSQVHAALINGLCFFEVMNENELEIQSQCLEQELEQGRKRRVQAMEVAQLEGRGARPLKRRCVANNMDQGQRALPNVNTHLPLPPPMQGATVPTMALQQTALPRPASHTTLPPPLTYVQVICLAPGMSVKDQVLDQAPWALPLDPDSAGSQPLSTELQPPALDLDLDLGLYEAPAQLVLDLDEGLDNAPTQHAPEESGLTGQMDASSVTALLDTDGEVATGGELEWMLLLDTNDESAGDGQADPAPEPVLQP